MTHPYGAWPMNRSAPKPGIIPLRPLTLGEILGGAAAVVRRHILILAPLAALVALVSGLSQWGVLVAGDAVGSYSTWATDLLDGRTTTVPVVLLSAVGLSLVVSMVGGVALATITSVYAAHATLGRPAGTVDIGARLRGQGLRILGIALAVGIIVAAGLALFVVPGILAYLAWLVAGPVVAMERAAVGTALRRSASLTLGSRGRIFGILVVSGLIGAAANTVVSALVGSIVGPMSASGVLLSTVITGTVVGAFTASWSAAIVAVVYIDLRMRREGLATTLAATAAADQLGRAV